MKELNLRIEKSNGKFTAIIKSESGIYKSEDFKTLREAIDDVVNMAFATCVISNSDILDSIEVTDKSIEGKYGTYGEYMREQYEMTTGVRDVWAKNDMSRVAWDQGWRWCKKFTRFFIEQKYGK